MDKQLDKLNKLEDKRQLETINLIASENYVSPAIREAMSSRLTNKYSEGYPGARYYPGNQYVDEVETLAQKEALKTFNLKNSTWGVNVQPYSGSPANFAVYAAVLEKNDTALGMALSSGGHLTHGFKVSHSGRFFNFFQYGVDKNGLLNYEEVENLAQKYKPRLIVCGASAYSRIIDFIKLSKIAKKYNALLMADIAHIAGLVATGVHPSPFSAKSGQALADIVTTTTHKTLRGPRGAIIFGRAELMPAINKSIFPGHQGGPHNHQTLAIAQAFIEAQTPKFKQYTVQIIKNTKTLAKELQKLNFNIVSGGTDNHLFLLDLTNKGVSGGDAEKLLEKNNIIANRNTVPNDPRKPFDPSGIRIGTPACTTRGMKEKEMKKIAQLIDKALCGQDVKNEAKKLAMEFPTP